MNHETYDPVQRPGYLLWHTAHALERELTAALAQYDLSLVQFGSLLFVSQEPGISSAEVARRSNVTPQSIQTALKPLLDRGLIERRPHPVHGRVLGIYASEEALDLIAEAGRSVDAVEDQLVRGFPAGDVQRLHELLYRALQTINPIALDRTSLRSQQ